MEWDAGKIALLYVSSFIRIKRQKWYIKWDTFREQIKKYIKWTPLTEEEPSRSASILSLYSGSKPRWTQLQTAFLTADPYGTPMLGSFCLCGKIFETSHLFYVAFLVLSVNGSHLLFFFYILNITFILELAYVKNREMIVITSNITTATMILL